MEKALTYEEAHPLTAVKIGLFLQCQQMPAFNVCQSLRHARQHSSDAKKFFQNP